MKEEGKRIHGRQVKMCLLGGLEMKMFRDKCILKILLQMNSEVENGREES